MNPITVLIIIVAYFSILLLISYFTGKEDSNEVFFKAKKESPWYIVAFGMIGATLSGVTFISVPGMIAGQQFAYMQGVFGFFVGTVFIVTVLLPLYYRLNVTSIYQYLEQRFGVVSYKTGAFFFILSRVMGASFRLFLVAISMQYIVFGQLGVPFWLTVVISILLIWIYTFRGGIKTIVWTDTLQTFAMLTAVFVAIYLINQKLDWTYFEFLGSDAFAERSRIFFFDDPNAKNYFWKYFIGGIFIAITMTGLDQDMMQKNLSCKSKKDSQKNMMTMISLLVIVNFVFLSLGALLFIFADRFGVSLPILDGKEKTDLLFPEIAVNQGLGLPLAITFLIGLIAAAYSSADSALTSLTTSVSIDFFNVEKRPESEQKPLRKKIHIGVSILLVFVVILFKQLDNNVVSNLFTFATYTYGPLLGLFAFGIFTKRKIKDNYVWLVSLISVILIVIVTKLPPSIIGAYQFSWEILPINGLFTFIGLWLISSVDNNDS